MGCYACSSSIFTPGGFVPELDNSSEGNRLYLKYPQGQASLLEKKFRVWLTNFSLNGDEDLSVKALFHQSQLLKKEPLYLRELIFQ